MLPIDVAVDDSVVADAQAGVGGGEGGTMSTRRVEADDIEAWTQHDLGDAQTVREAEVENAAQGRERAASKMWPLNV